MSDVRAEWAGRDRFYELAEALGCDTDLIMGAMNHDGLIACTYTPDYPKDDTIWGAMLRRDDDGVMRVLTKRRTDQRMSDITAQIDAQMAREQRAKQHIQPDDPDAYPRPEGS